jgi:hypothetical protein
VEKNSRGKNNGGKGKRSRAMTFKLNERERVRHMREDPIARECAEGA